MQKVVYVIPKTKIGGAESLFNEIDQGDYDGIDLYKYDLNIQTNNPYIYLSSLVKFLLFIKKNKIDFVISSLWKSHLISFFVCIFSNIKSIPFIHSSSFFNFYDRFFTNLLLYSSKACIVDSNKSCDFVESKFKHIDVFKVSTHIKFKNYSSTGKNYLSLDKDLLRFIFLGRICDVKRIDKSIALLNNLVQHQIDVVFDLFGPIEVSHSKIKKWEDSSNFKINFNSPLERNQIPHILRGYDFYIQLSDIEGMAMSVIESMSLGLIPLVTKVGEISNYCEHGKNSLCYDKEDSVGSISENFLEHLSNLNNLNSMSKNAIQTSKTYLDFKIDFILKIRKAANSYV